MIKRNWSSIWKISLLVLKYVFIFLISILVSLKEVAILVFISFLVVDVIVGYLEKEVIFKRLTSLGIVFLKFYFWFIVILDNYLIVSFLNEKGMLEDDCSNELKQFMLILFQLYMLSCVLRFPIQPFMSNDDRKNKRYLKNIIVFVLEIGVLFFINELLLGGEDIILAVFSGVVVVFVKWLYSEDGLYFFVGNSSDFDKEMISDEIKVKFKKIQGRIVIVLVSLTLAVSIKKLCLKKYIIVLFMSEISKRFSLQSELISNYFVILTTLVLSSCIQCYIMRPGNIVTKIHQDEVVRIANEISKKEE